MKPPTCPDPAVFQKHESPWVFGRLTSLAAATSIGIGLLIWLMMSYLSFSLVYLIVGGLMHRPDFGPSPATRRIPRPCPSEADGAEKTILALLFPHLYGRCAAPDLHRVLGAAAGQKFNYSSRR